jgi:hypothetical protein
MSRPTRLLSIALLALAALVASGCGAGHSSLHKTAETEGIYLDLSGMKYQVQISRYLNASDVQDRAFLAGVPAGTEPAGDETWFGVFMRVENDSDRPQRAASDFEIVDTQENVYRPVSLDASANPFAYEASEVEPRSIIPLPDSAAGTTPIQGSLLLFKVKTESLQNRPLEFHILGGGGDRATVSLDV